MCLCKVGRERENIEQIHQETETPNIAVFLSCFFLGENENKGGAVGMAKRKYSDRNA